MSSLTTRPNGHQWVFFKFNDKRHTVRLGPITRLDAEDFRRKLDRLLSTRAAGMSVDIELRRWVDSLKDRPHHSLVQAGLVEPRKNLTIGGLNDAYLHHLQQDGPKPRTIINAQATCRCLVRFFGRDRVCEDITREETEKFRQWMLKEGGVKGKPMAPTTTSRACRRARTIFKFAVDEGWIDKNPFGRMKRWIEVNTARDAYVTRETIQRLIDAAPDAEFRLLLAIVRYCGLRCPSEIQPLHWDWVDWDAGVFRVFAPKTEHHAGQAWREVPILEDVRPYIYDAFELALTGQIHVFPNYQFTGNAISSRLRRLCTKAGVEVWPKPWVNLRASCERDLLKQYPIDQAAAWLGHSPETALRHYSRVAKEQQTRSAGRPRASGSDGPEKPKQASKRRSLPDAERYGTI